MTMKNKTILGLLKYSIELAHGFSVVLHVLQDVAAVDHVDGLIGKMDIRDIHLQHSFSVQIRRDVVLPPAAS
jgi:hypothetical protein